MTDQSVVRPGRAAVAKCPRALAQRATAAVVFTVSLEPTHPPTPNQAQPHRNKVFIVNVMNPTTTTHPKPNKKEALVYVLEQWPTSVFRP